MYRFLAYLSYYKYMSCEQIRLFLSKLGKNIQTILHGKHRKVEKAC